MIQEFWMWFWGDPLGKVIFFGLSIFFVLNLFFWVGKKLQEDW